MKILFENSQCYIICDQNNLASHGTSGVILFFSSNLLEKFFFRFSITYTFLHKKMSSLPKSTSSIISFASNGQSLPSLSAATSQRRNVEIPRKGIPTSSSLQYSGSATQEIPIIVLNNEIIAMLTRMDRHVTK